jgi:SAM-dependent methyltransferase
MAEGIDRELTRRYLDRRVDGRMVALIDRELAGAGSVLDVGCGPGLYGPALRRRAARVAGLDHDPVLCRQAEATGAYDLVICASVARLADHLDRVDAVFCSELVEHVPRRELRATLDMLESVATARVVITVPNRLFPHAHMDPTHVLRYRLGSLLAELNRSRRFRYSLHPLGFASHWSQRPWCRPLDAVARRVAVCSPTVLFLGRPHNPPVRPADPGLVPPVRPADPGAGR